MFFSQFNGTFVILSNIFFFNKCFNFLGKRIIVIEKLFFPTFSIFYYFVTFYLNFCQPIKMYSCSQTFHIISRTQFFSKIKVCSKYFDILTFFPLNRNCPQFFNFLIFFPIFHIFLKTNLFYMHILSFKMSDIHNFFYFIKIFFYFHKCFIFPRKCYFSSNWHYFARFQIFHFFCPFDQNVYDLIEHLKLFNKCSLFLKNLIFGATGTHSALTYWVVEDASRHLQTWRFCILLTAIPSVR